MDKEYWARLFGEIKGIRDTRDARSERDERNARSERDVEYNNTRMKSHLVKNGFQGGEIYLKEFRLTTRLGEREYYMRQIEKNIKETLMLIGTLFKQKTPANKDLGGYYGMLDISFKGIPAKLHLVLVEDTVELNPARCLHSIGHEDGHFLDFTGMRELIYEKYEVRKKHQKRMRGRESFADFCGWVSVFNISGGFLGFKIDGKKSRAGREEPASIETTRRTLEIAKEVLLGK